MFTVLYLFLYKYLFLDFTFTKPIFQHFTRGLWYFSFLSLFRYIVTIKCNYEFSNLSANNYGLYYCRLDKVGDVYRFGVGQFYDNLTIKKLYSNREKLIKKDIESIYQEYQEVFYLCIIYSIIITAIAMLTSSILALAGIIPFFMLKYIIVVIMSKNCITFVTSFRTIHDVIAKYPVTLFINLLQVFMPIILYLYVLPKLNITFHFMSYVISAFCVNFVSFIVYYFSLYLTLGRLLTPKTTRVSFMQTLRDFNYLVYTLTKNILSFTLPDLCLLIIARNIDYNDQLSTIYLVSNGMRNIVGTFETPLDWLNRVFISQYQNTRNFLISAYLVSSIYFILFGTLVSYLIRLGVYNYFMVIKFNNVKYFHLAFLLAVLSVICKVWENITVVQKKDLYPLYVLMCGATIYILSAFIFFNKMNINILLSLFYSTMFSIIIQYILFISRARHALQLNVKHILFEFFRYTTLAGLMYNIARFIIV